MQEQIQRGYFATYNMVKEAIIANSQKRYKFGTDIAKTMGGGITSDSFEEVGGNIPLAQLKTFYNLQSGKGFKEVFNNKWII